MDLTLDDSPEAPPKVFTACLPSVPVEAVPHERALVPKVSFLAVADGAAISGTLEVLGRVGSPVRLRLRLAGRIAPVETEPDGRREHSGKTLRAVRNQM